MMNEEQIDNWLKMREEDAWNRVKEKMTTPKMTLEMADLIKGAFIIGYQLGTIDEEKMVKAAIRHSSKTDPVAFLEWLKEDDKDGDA